MTAHAEPSGSLASRWLAPLGQRSLPHFNQFVIWLLLASAAIVACLPFTVREGQRHGHTTLLFWLPDSLLDSAAMFWLFRGMLIVGIGLWALNRWLPWSCWWVTLGMAGLWSMHVENTYNTSHIFHMANILLAIQSIWITADAAQIQRALASGTYWQTRLVPGWVSLAAIAYIGLFHTAAGLSKLTFSGPGWASGTSLQIWTYLWGFPWSPTTQWIVGSRTLTRGLQIGTLVIETAGVFAIVPRLRPWIGLGLLGFYAGVLATFDYGFELNALFTAIYLLPVERWFMHRQERASLQSSDGQSVAGTARSTGSAK
jgi:hypothetical protein